MAVKYGRKSADAAHNIREAVGNLLSCGSFSVGEFLLPPEGGAQLSMTGDVVAYGNVGGFGASLPSVLRSYPAIERATESERDKFVRRMRFTVLCGGCDRSVAIFESICEAVRCGIVRMVVIADSASERENLFRSLRLMCAGKHGIEVTEYHADDYDFFVKYKSMAIVYGFLTSTDAQVLVVGRDSLARRNNIINRTHGGEAMSSFIAKAKPIVFTSSATVDSGRTLAAIAEMFDPMATVIYSGEVRRLRDAVIYEPSDSANRKESAKKNEPMQLGF